MTKILDIAAEEIGYMENPPNSNMTKYGAWFGFDGAKWCGMFVSWVYFMAGFPLGNIGFLKGFAGCQTALKHFTKTGEITTNPQPDDIVLFDWKGSGTPTHTAIFETKLDDWFFLSIEGNTSVSGSQNNGGAVCRKKRPFKGAIFIHPNILNKL